MPDFESFQSEVEGKQERGGVAGDKIDWRFTTEDARIKLERLYSNRMPVILHPQDYELWLHPDFDEKEPIATLLKPYPAEAMEAYAVSRRVNSPSNNEPNCIESLA